MRFINKKLYFIFFIFILAFLFTGCSSKRTFYNYNSFYKSTGNKNINNSQAMHRATMRPYKVLGVNYYPFTPKIGDTFDGIASWYGPDFHAKKTSNGEIYNMHALTAAHKTLPMNTVVKVYNVENGRTTIVRINDRGPFVSGRIIDLSNKAAHEIDMVKKGTARVKITVLGFNGLINSRSTAIVEQKSVAKSNTKTTKTFLDKGNFSIQLGAFSLKDGAVRTAEEYQAKFPSRKVEYSESGGIYRVYIRGFASYETGQDFRDNNGLTNAIVIQN